MKLSDAIRAGAQGTGQAIAELTDGNGNYCALGAALRGIGLPHDEIEYITTLDPEDALTETRDRLNGAAMDLDRVMSHPKRPWDDDLFGIVVDLNDCWRMSREEISDWLEEQGL